MTEQSIRTVPQANGEAPLPKRQQNGVRTMLPSSWIARTVALQYQDAFGEGQQSSGTLLDWCPVGVIVSLSGQKTVVAWDCLRAVTLVND